ncbi:MAG TPA: tRNA 2-thiouridine(34) synthase MnmA, partial [Clostridiaceae bacterium]|nr:tRNA 2-thiouridine(34) synthase MnmA [Clostridiaceae bacterium]
MRISVDTQISKQNHCSKKALVAMSGGVDSTVALALMVAQGYETMGATLKLRSERLDINADQSCCTPRDIED